MIDICAEKGWLVTVLRTQQLMQCIVQARWLDEPNVLTLPHVADQNVPLFRRLLSNCSFITLPALKDRYQRNYEQMATVLRDDFDEAQIENIFRVLCDMPTINVAIVVRGQYFDQDDVERTIVQPPTRDTWLQVHANQEYTINVQLTRLGKKTGNSIHCPKFPKGKDEGWFMTLGCANTGELIAMKRIAYRSNRSAHQLSFFVPQKIGNFLAFRQDFVAPINAF